MRKNQIVFQTILLVPLLLILGCTSSQVDNSKLRAAILSANEKFAEYVKSVNSAGLASLYTANGQLLPPNGDIVSGKPAIQSFWQGGIDMGIKSATLETIEVEGLANTAYEVGKYTLLAESDQMIDTGKYIVIWKLEDGQWKLHRDIWNSSMPATK